MLLVILICITALFIVFAGVALYKDNDDLLGVSLAMLLIIVLLGWLTLGSVMPQSEVNETVIVNVLHDKNSVHISYDGKVVKSFTDIATFNYLADKNEIKAQVTRSKNMYGGLVSEKWELVP